jgi:hypothetical protein
MIQNGAFQSSICAPLILVRFEVGKTWQTLEDPDSAQYFRLEVQFEATPAYRKNAKTSENFNNAGDGSKHDTKK